MQLEVKVDAEAVQQHLVQSLINSAVGKQIEKAITELLTKQFGEWHNKQTLVEAAVADVLRQELYKLAREVVEEKREQFRALIVAKLADENLAGLVDAWLKNQKG